MWLLFSSTNTMTASLRPLRRSLTSGCLSSTESSGLERWIAMSTPSCARKREPLFSLLLRFILPIPSQSSPLPKITLSKSCRKSQPSTCIPISSKSPMPTSTPSLPKTPACLRSSSSLIRKMCQWSTRD